MLGVEEMNHFGHVRSDLADKVIAHHLHRHIDRRRKAEVVAAVRGGLISIEEACERYKLTVDEFLSWQRSIDRYGLPGLRATRIQDYRD